MNFHAFLPDSSFPFEISNFLLFDFTLFDDML
jgi:hypothetical protein